MRRTFQEEVGCELCGGDGIVNARSFWLCIDEKQNVELRSLPTSSLLPPSFPSSSPPSFSPFQTLGAFEGCSEAKEVSESPVVGRYAYWAWSVGEPTMFSSWVGLKTVSGEPGDASLTVVAGSRLCVLVSSEKPLREAEYGNPCSLCAAGRSGPSGQQCLCLPAPLAALPNDFLATQSCPPLPPPPRASA